MATAETYAVIDVDEIAFREEVGEWSEFHMKDGRVVKVGPKELVGADGGDIRLDAHPLQIARTWLRTATVSDDERKEPKDPDEHPSGCYRFAVLVERLRSMILTLMQIEDPENECAPLTVLADLVQDDEERFRLFHTALRYGYSEEEWGNCHEASIGLLFDLARAGRDSGWKLARGQVTFRDGSRGLHSWLEFQGWAIDGACGGSAGHAPVFFQTVKNYREKMKARDVRLRDYHATRRWLAMRPKWRKYAEVEGRVIEARRQQEN